MSEYAYRDKARKDIIYASSALAEDRGKIFFCPNAECGANLYLCAVDGSTSAYFRATKQEYHHIDGCPYKSNSNNFKDELYDEEKFVFDDAIVNLFSGINEKKIVRIQENTVLEMLKNTLLGPLVRFIGCVRVEKLQISMEIKRSVI